MSSILIFWKGSTKNPAEISLKKDSDYLRGDEYSRAIAAVGQAFILDHFQAYGGPTPPPIDHQGVNDAIVEAASVVHYFFRGKWLQLQGAD